MRPALPEEVHHPLARFVAERLRPDVVDREGSIPASLLGELAELGVFGLTVPERFGGAGLSLGAACELVEILAARDRSVATTVGLHLGLGTRALLRFAPPSLQERYLPEVARGARIAAFAATEPEAGSDLSQVRTRAVEASGELLLEGEKIYVTNARHAGLLTVLAHRPGGVGPRAQCLVVLDPRGPGVELGREEHKLGLRGSSTAGVRLAGARVPQEHALDAPAGEPPILEQVLAAGRTLMAAGCAGAARAALARATEHVAVRRQFGRPLAAQEVVRRQLAEMAATSFALWALLAETWAVEDDVEAFLFRSLALKVFASESAWALADGSLQLLGGFGFIEDSGAPLLLRDVRVSRIFEGANDVLLTRLGGWLLAPPAAAAGPALAAEQARAAELKRRLGVRAYRRTAELHQLGRRAVLAFATDAAERSAADHPDPWARAAAAHWRAVATARRRALESELSPAGEVDAVVDALLAQGGPR